MGKFGGVLNMKKITVITIILIILGSWSVLFAGPNDTETEEQFVKS